MFHERFPPDIVERGSTKRWTVAFFVATAILVAASALFRAANKDESQYVAAIALIRQGWPYLDFAYLQTPLQPLVLGPLAALPAGCVYAGVRAANAFFGFGTLLVLFASLRGRSSRRSALVALAALACTQPFLLAASLARNDALPMLLIASGVAALLRASRERSLRAFAIGGLFLGLATSAKISAALPAAGAVLFLVIRVRTYGIRSLVALAVGAFVGLLPCIVFAVASPSEFRFDVFAYSLQAPVQWWTSVGRTVDLEATHRIVHLIELSAQGSILVALASALFDRGGGDDRLLLDLMIIGGVVGSYMPEPAYAQYLVPLLAPLFARFALALDDAPHRWRACLFALAGAGSIAGLGFAASHVGDRIGVAEATGIGSRTAALAKGGRIASLSPEFVGGSGANLDPRFAAGPFLFRTTDGLATQAERFGHAVSWQDVQRSFERDPPAVILAGGEKSAHRPMRTHGLDAPLIGWALSQGYRPVPVGGGFVAYVSPSKRARCADSAAATQSSQLRVSLYSPAADFSFTVMHLPWRISSRQLPSALTTRSPLGTRLPSLMV